MCTSEDRAPVELLRTGAARLAGDAAAVADLVAAVRAGLAALANVDVTDLPDAVVRGQLRELLPAVNALDAVAATWVGSFDARDLADADGLRTTRTWLRAFGRMSQGAATGLLSRGRLLRRLPSLGEAARTGAVSAEQVDVVLRLTRKIGLSEVSRFDAILADLAAAAGPAEVRTACQRIYHHVDPDGPAPDPEHDLARRELTWARCGSMLHLRGRLDPEAAALVQTALDALMPPPRAGDERTAPQRRADALAELARQQLHGGRLPTVGGCRPQLGILVTPTTLFGQCATQTTTAMPGQSGGIGGPTQPPSTICEGGASDRPAQSAGPSDSGAAVDPLTAAGVAELAERPSLTWIGEVSPELAHRLACDCEAFSVLLDPANGTPLYLGRSRRLVPPHVRKALYARDRGCRWPGCDAPSAWTDAHHVIPWYLGGSTNIDELLLLCRYHHGKVHEGRWRIHFDPATGEVSVWRPDGSPYELQPSQPWLSPSRRRRRGYEAAPGWPDPAEDGGG